MNFSVIIPTRNRPNLLIKLLQSIDENKFNGKLDIIIINNSPLEKMGKNIPHYKFRNAHYSLRIFEESRVGPSFARNTGATNAMWEHIIFIDDDCILPQDYFMLYERLWVLYPKAKIIGGKVLPTKEKGIFSQTQLDTINSYYGCFGITQLGENNHYLTLGELIYSANMSYHLSPHRKDKIFDERLGRQLTNTIAIYAEDYELCSRLILSGEHLVYSPVIINYNHIPDYRFNTKYLRSRQIISGFEQALMEKILNETFDNAYEQASVLSVYKKACRDICHGKSIRSNLRFFNSRLKIAFVLSYLIHKLFVFS